MVGFHEIAERGEDVENNEADQLLGGHGNTWGQSIGQVQIVVGPGI